MSKKNINIDIESILDDFKLPQNMLNQSIQISKEDFKKQKEDLEDLEECDSCKI